VAGKCNGDATDTSIEKIPYSESAKSSCFPFFRTPDCERRENSTECDGMFAVHVLYVNHSPHKLYELREEYCIHVKILIMNVNAENDKT
jgi:hypothetical protein